MKIKNRLNRMRDDNAEKIDRLPDEKFDNLVKILGFNDYNEFNLMFRDCKDNPIKIKKILEDLTRPKHLVRDERIDLILS